MRIADYINIWSRQAAEDRTTQDVVHYRPELIWNDLSGERNSGFCHPQTPPHGLPCPVHPVQTGLPQICRSVYRLRSQGGLSTATQGLARCQALKLRCARSGVA